MASALSKDRVEHALGLHRRSIVVDTHNHVPCGDDIDDRMVGGMDCKFYLASVYMQPEDFHDAPIRSDNLGRCYESEGKPRGAFNAIDQMYLDIERNQDRLGLALTANDVIENKKRGKLSVILGFEGSQPLDGSISLLGAFHRLGLRHMVLTGPFANQVSGGSRDPRAGLTNFGTGVVSECNRLGVVVDISHISKTGFWDVLKESKKPTLVAHSGARALVDPSGKSANQLLSDEQIKALVEGDGVITLHFFGFVITGRDEGDVNTLLNHVDYITKLMGSVDCIGIGPDIYPKTEPWLTYYDTMVRERKRGPGEAFRQPKLLLDGPGKLPEFTVGLVERGYSDDEVGKSSVERPETRQVCHRRIGSDPNRSARI
jgi:microsomal dipeptidase-like Zn-dependent dipeptidase